MQVRGLQEIKIKFHAEENVAENLYDALLEKFGDWDYEEYNGDYELTKVEPIIIDTFDGDEIDSPYETHDSWIKVDDVENFIRQWDRDYEIDGLIVTEEVGREE